MNKKILPHLTTAQAILILVSANLVAMGYIVSLTNYNHDQAAQTQKGIVELINNQGNISNMQRQKIIRGLEDLPGQQLNNTHLLEKILGNMTHKQ